MSLTERTYLPLAVFSLTFILLAIVQVKVADQMLLLERFFEGGGWIEIILVSLYASMLAYFMRDPGKAPKWRRTTWTVFSVVFFLQLAAGLMVSDIFLMTGRLHFPIPAMIIAGPVYRGQLSVMPVLFLSTLLLTGPAWCSHFCYFGAFDNTAASFKKKGHNVKHKKAVKAATLILVVAVTIILRFLKVTALTATIIAGTLGIASILIMVFYSSREGKMIHCIKFCPVGTMVNLFKYVNPFRMYIENTCNLCMRCSTHCRYDALGAADIKERKPGYTCTLCGDCLPACHSGSIKYKFLKLDSETARNLYLFLTISVHAVFLALARI
jgi:ferredoxin-type protein NapH